ALASEQMAVRRWRAVPFLVGFFGMLLLLFAAAEWQERVLRDDLRILEALRRARIPFELFDPRL
ncbi:MAG TPA: hypothetical protein VFZ12_04115, partial [Dehalococcoidia bacterium]|nr:hypothetical protein [Dehalococcoidia bacterium]